MQRFPMTAIIALPLLAPWALGQMSQYTVTEIGRLPGAFSTVPFAMNNHGDVVGFCQGPGTIVRAFIYHPGAGISEIPPPPGFAESRAADITDTGLIVGAAMNGLTDPPRGWILLGRVYAILPAFPDGCPGMIPNAINEAGAVVGRTCPSGGGNSRAFYWNAATGLLDLNAMVGAATVDDINNAGVVAGGSFTGAFRWSPQIGYQPVGVLGAPYDDYAHALGINESGDVVGRSMYAQSSSTGARAFLYTDGAGIIQIGPGVGFREEAHAINESGAVVGYSGTDSSPFGNAWICAPGAGAIVLNSVVSDPRFFGYRRAVDLNDSGQIACWAIGQTDTAVAVVLTPRATQPHNGPGSARTHPRL
jgi:probable HAF family extracellular repeat protein